MIRYSRYSQDDTILHNATRKIYAGGRTAENTVENITTAESEGTIFYHLHYLRSVQNRIKGH